MVLVIDDDPTVAPLVSGLLSAGGEGHLDVETAPTLAGGLAIFRSQSEAPCVVLLDLRLPDSDGLATLATCRECCGGASPIVVLTADGDRSLAVAALREGADDFLLKTELTAHTLARMLRFSIERQQYRAALRIAEARAGAVLRSIDSMIGLIGPDGRLIEVNEAWRSFATRTGCPVMNAQPGVPFVDFCRDLRHAFGDVLVGAVESLLAGEAARFERVVSGMPPCGSQVHLRVRGCLLDLPHGRGVAIVMDDFTEKVGFERQLRESSERMAVAIEAGHVGTFTYDLETGHVEWSPWHFRIAGLRPGEYSGTLSGFLAMVHPDDRDRVVVEMESCRQLRQPIRTAYRIVRPDGAVRFVEGEARYTFDVHGNAVRLSGAIVDVTDRRLATARQGMSQRLEALGELSTGVAHDLRNALSLAHAALARLDEARAAGATLADPLAHEAVADLRLVTHQAGQLVGTLVDFAKPRREGPTPTVNLNDVVLQFASFLRRLLPNTLRLGVECGREPAVVTVEPVHLQQILMNLVLNARDAMRGQGEVRIRVVPGMLFHRIEVADNGPGIPETDRSHLFEPFVRGRSEGEGSGLGLAIVKSIVDASAGSISIDSAPGTGCVFRIQWPASKDVEGDGARPGSIIEAKAARLIVLVQSEGYARRVLADGLAEQGYVVHEAADVGAAAIEIRRSGLRPAAIVVDEDQGGEGGTAIRESLTALRLVGCVAPTIVLTESQEATEEEEECLLIPKPCSIGQVFAAVRAVLDLEGEGERPEQLERMKDDRSAGGPTSEASS